MWGSDTSCSFAAFERLAHQALTGEWIEPVMLNMHPIVSGCVHQTYCQHIFCFSLCLPPPPAFVAVVGNLYSFYLIQEDFAGNHAASARAGLLKKYNHIYLIFIFFPQEASKITPWEGRTVISKAGSLTHNSAWANPAWTEFRWIRNPKRRLNLGLKYGEILNALQIFEAISTLPYEMDFFFPQ